MNESQEHLSEPKESPTQEERLSTLVGHRLCVKCGYNLSGQWVLREPHYQMLIVRCPECGTVASLQEYPLLGRWASWWAVVLAGLWVLVLLFLLLMPPFPIVASAYLYAHASLDPLVDHLGEAQSQWTTEQGRAAPEAPDWGWSPPRRGGFIHSRYTSLESDWWAQLDRAEFLAERGGWIRVANWAVMRSWVTFGWIMLTVLGIVWALVVPHVRRRWLPLVALPVIGVCVGYWAIGGDTFGVTWWVSDLEDAAMEMIGSKVALALIVLSAVPITIGMLIGRTVARLFIRAMLPPRLRGALAGLWTCDGLTPPKGR